MKTLQEMTNGKKLRILMISLQSETYQALEFGLDQVKQINCFKWFMLIYRRTNKKIANLIDYNVNKLYKRKLLLANLLLLFS